jgi:thiol-disulfide isomerase/thioredoxin
MKLVSVFLLAAAAWGVIAMSQTAVSAETGFNKVQYDKLMTEGKPIVVEFHAPWCPVCKTQKILVGEIAIEPAFKDVAFLSADFDKEVALKKEMRVSTQSTFVVFKNGKEVARSTGQTKKQELTSLFAKAL